MNPIHASYDARNYGGLPPAGGLQRAAGQDIMHGLGSPRNAGMMRPPRPENYQHSH